jgi:hypothetical protein
MNNERKYTIGNKEYSPTYPFWECLITYYQDTLKTEQDAAIDKYKKSIEELRKFMQ